jgi:hypothetical protein
MKEQETHFNILRGCYEREGVKSYRKLRGKKVIRAGK